jgi:uncharacterized protein YjdB
VNGAIRNFKFASVIAVVALSTACSRPKSLSIDPPNPQLVEAGQKTSLHPVFKDGSGTMLEKGPPVKWTSNKPDVATVDANGAVTAVKSGEATITAVSEKAFMVDSMTATTNVNVSIPARITVQDTDVVLGKTATLKPTVVDEIGRPTKVQPGTIEVTLENPAIATVAVSGAQKEERVITGVAVGETKGIAKSGKVTTDFKVTVKLPEFSDLKVDPTELKLKKGETGKITAKAMNGEAEVAGIPFTFTSSDVAIATVDAEGTVTAVAPGTANIEVKGGAKTATVAVTVPKK